MSRFCGDDDATPILRAGAHWRESCLLGEGSVFGPEPLWRLAALREIDEYFVKRPDLGGGSFLEKLKQQLDPVSPQAHRLVAEMMWVLYLCPSSITARHKLAIVQTISAWSGAPLAPESPWLDASVLKGVGSAGPGFNQNQWRELAFFTNLLLKLLALPTHERQALLNDAWGFATWLKNVQDWRHRQFRHMVLFLLFPDSFERVFGGTDRRVIAEVFSGRARREIGRLDPFQVDELLRNIRADLEKKYQTKELDFYISPLKERWKTEAFAVATEAVTPGHIRQALAEIDHGGIPSDAESSTYDLLADGRRYPPKLVLSRAVKFASGEELDRGSFAGGEGTPAFALLGRLGFEIVPKDAIKELIERFLAQAAQGNNLVVQGYLKNYRGLTVKVSFGTGNVSRIPWIAFLGTGQAVSDGIYPVLLLFKEVKQLLLCYGVSETNPPAIPWSSVNGTPTVSQWFEKELGARPDRYGDSHVVAAYRWNDQIDFPDLTQKLDLLIDRYKAQLGPISKDNPPTSPKPETQEVTTDLAGAVSAFASALRKSSLDFGISHDDLIRSFVSSLVTKPFVILTGLSGSGKTQLALRFGEWLGPDRLRVAAVRPDWTGAEAIFGYEDALKAVDDDGNAAWSVPAPLEFMLRAARDPQHPYLFLLDEMNLAHVERYFADVLSGMETAKECLPNLVKGSGGVWRTQKGQPQQIGFPRNLWIVGTVNVDETTYMFSPKVLDRANTFEFRVDTSSLNESGRRPSECQPGDQSLVRGLLAIAKDDSWHQDNRPTCHDQIVSQLRVIHRVLSRYGMEFGHRVFYESVRFAAMAEESGLSSVAVILDCIVLQKILPKLHGSRRKLETPLLALSHFASNLPDDVPSDEELTSSDLQTPQAGPALPRSFDKLSRMLKSVRTNQFVSFAE